MKALRKLFTLPRGRAWLPQRRRRLPAWALSRPKIEALEERALLSTFLVTSLGDQGIGEAFQGDLRYAINMADFNPDPSNRITFQPGLTGTITLSLGVLPITKDLEIDGPGAGLLTISGNHRSQVFSIPDTDVTHHVTISDLTIANGRFTRTDTALFGGGAIEVARGNLTLNRCVLAGNESVGTLPNDPFAHGGAIYNQSGTLTLNSCTVTGNHADGNGGGIEDLGSMTLVDSTVAGNSSGGEDGGGGGIHEAPGRLGAQSFIIRSVITGNASKSGGGVYHSLGALTIEDSHITDNSATNAGGGIEVLTAPLTIVDSTIADNHSDFVGGGIGSNFRPGVTISGSTISGNSASGGDLPGGGGGILVSFEGNFTLTNCTISGNSADYGGAINLGFGSFLELTSTTITDNSATTEGGGVLNNTNPFGIARVIMRNSLVAGNQTWGASPDISGPVISAGYNLIAEADGSSGWVTHDLTGTSDAPLDAKLGPLEDNGGPTLTHALQADSPARTVGDPTLYNTFDQRGSQRQVYTTVDIGAVQSGLLRRFRVTAPDRVFAGEPFTISVTALDYSDTVAFAYADATVFHSSDPAAALPDPYTFAPSDLGRQTFTVTLNSVGSQSIRVSFWQETQWGDVNVQVEDPAASVKGSQRSPAWWFEASGVSDAAFPWGWVGRKRGIGPFLRA